MFDYIKDTDIKWNKDTIKQHGNEMIDLLASKLQVAEHAPSQFLADNLIQPML